MARAFIALLEAIVLPLGNRSARDQRRLVGCLRISSSRPMRAPKLAERAANLLASRAEDSDNQMTARGMTRN